MIIYELFKSVEIGANEYDIGIQDIIFWRPFSEMADLVDFSNDYGSTSTGLESK